MNLVPHGSVEAQYNAHPEADDKDDCAEYGDEYFIPAIDVSELSHEGRL
jgi:hypothetical protein